MSTNIKDKWWFMVGLVVLGIVLQRYLIPLPPDKPNIQPTYQIIRTVPSIPDVKGSLRLDYETDKDISGIQFSITNDGEKQAVNFEIDIVLMNKSIKIQTSKLIFEPPRIQDRVIDSSDDDCSFYRKLSSFPCDARIILILESSLPISEHDIRFDFLSEGYVWKAEEGKINLKKGSSSIWSMFGKLFDCVRLAQSTETQKPESEKESQKQPYSGILIGGYDPLRLANNTFVLIQEKHLISPNEVKLAKYEIENYKKGVLFGGINPLKFNEVILNALLRNGRISKQDAEMCLAKSSQSGGVLISGYNVIVLNVEILNKLIKNGWITREEGQTAVDDAKLKWEDRPGLEWPDRPGLEYMDRSADK